MLSLVLVSLYFGVLILQLQKVIGPQFMVPKNYKEIPYNYYIPYSEIVTGNQQLKECCICLEDFLTYESSINKQNLTTSDESLGNQHQELSHSAIYKTSKCSKQYFMQLRIRIAQKKDEYIDSLKYKYNKTAYMKTPCNHLFHSQCMEIWMEKKCECPSCRTKIPSLAC